MARKARRRPHRAQASHKRPIDSTTFSGQRVRGTNIHELYRDEPRLFIGAFWEKDKLGNKGWCTVIGTDRESILTGSPHPKTQCELGFAETWQQAVEGMRGPIARHFPNATVEILWETSPLPDPSIFAECHTLTPRFHIAFVFGILAILRAWAERGDLYEPEPHLAPEPEPAGSSLRSRQPDSLPAWWRSDAPLVRAIAKERGETIAAQVARLPLVSIAPDQIERIRTRWKEIAEAIPIIPGLPWAEFLVDFGAAFPELRWVLFGSRGSRLIRTVQGLVPEEIACHDVWCLLFFGPDPTRGCGLGLPLDEWGALYEMDMECWAINAETPVDAERMQNTVQLLCATLAYFWMMPEFFVERRPTAPPPGRHAGKENKKPWTQPRPHIVMIDPVHRIHRERQEPVGTHASPIGHPRRGYLSVLKHPRFYRFPYSDVIHGERPLVAPPELDWCYRTESFVSGATRSGEILVFRKVVDGWLRLVTRTLDLRPTWVGPKEGRERDGTLYRVLDRPQIPILPVVP